MKPSLDGVNGKIRRAKHHLDELKRVLNERPAPEADDSTWVDHETERRVFATGFKKTPEVPLDARLLIGDVVHSLAAALDHLVYQLSLSHQLAIGTTDAVAVCDAHKTHFPIFRERKTATVNAEAIIKKRIELMAQAPADLIRSMQPYKRQELYPILVADEDPLWILFKLDVIDKHRVVVATNEIVTADKVTVTFPGADPKTYVVPDAKWQPSEAGTPFFRFTLPIGYELHPEVRLNVDLKLSILFAETGQWCDGKPVLELLRKLIEFIERAVIAPPAPYVV